MSHGLPLVMRKTILLPLIFGAMVLRGTATEEDEKKVPTLDGIIFDEQIWEKTLVDIKGPEERVEDQAEIPAELRKGLRVRDSPGPGSVRWIRMAFIEERRTARPAGEFRIPRQGGG